jgi:YVTN family beta-propeller protein
MNLFARRGALCAAHLAVVLAAPAVAAAQSNLAYVCASAGDRVAVLDATSGAASASIAVGDGPSRAALSRDGARLYVANTLADTLSVVDTATHAVLASIAVGDAPGELAVSPDGARVYVMVANGVVDVVDTAAGAVVQSFASGTGSGGLALTPDGSKLYVAGGAIAALDAASGVVLSTQVVGTAALDVAISPDGSRAFATFYTFYFSPVFSAGGSVAVLDTSTDAIVGYVGVGSLPSQIALSPDGSRGFVGLTATWANTGYAAGFLPIKVVASFDTATFAVTSWTLVGGTPAGIAVSADGARVLVATPSVNQVALLNAATGALSGNVAVAGGPTHVVTAELTSVSSYCTSGTSTNGCVPTARGWGYACASETSGFQIEIAGLEGQRSGLVLYGVSGASLTPWGGGSSYLCVKAPTQRTSPLSSGGTDGACDGAFLLDFNAWLAANPSALGQPFAAATSVCAQGWYRDPPASKATNLSHALEFVVQP